jgi:hypothetical protein
MTTAIAPANVRIHSCHPWGIMMSAEHVTARYRAAKKHQSDKAISVGALRSEAATLKSRIAQYKNAGQDTGALDIIATRTRSRLEEAQADLAAAANEYRVAHIELLMTPGPQKHYLDAISKQRLLAKISQDDNEQAVLQAMQSTITLILALVANRTAAASWAEQTAAEPAPRELSDLKESADAATTGAFRSARGTVIEVIDLGGGVLGTSRGPLGRVPYDYIPGLPFADGHLMLNGAVQLAKYVDPATPTGYSAAHSIIV